MALRLDYITASDRGLVRGNNEDSAYAGPYLLVLADGMGGHAAGEVASQLMVEHLEFLDQDPGDNDMLALIAGAADDANASIAAGVRQHPEQEGMGTTLTALMFNGRHFALCHVGDSRAYRLRAGKLEQLTVDDTYVQSLVAAGELDPAEVSTHPRRSLILKAYTGAPVEPTLLCLDAQPGDRLLLCSDGLTDPVTHETIETALAHGTPSQAAEKLIDLALRSGGPDNVTVVIADVVDDATLGEESRENLPSRPLTAGALQATGLDATAAPTPDTAAGRAAAWHSQQQALQQRQPREIPSPAQAEAAGIDALAASAGTAPSELGAQPEGEASAGAGAGTGEPAGRGRRGLAAVIGVLVLVIALILGGWWAFSAAQNRYFVTVDTARGDTLTVQRGYNYEVFGVALHRPYQESCLDSAGSLRLLAPDSPEASPTCTPFKLQDLPENVRAQATSTQVGDYDAVTRQLRELASQALPVCVTRDPATGSTGTATGTPGTAGKAGTTSANTAAKPEGDLSQPGVNCREVRQ